MDPEKLRDNIYQLLTIQRLAVLSTNDKGRPYASLVAFCFSADLRMMYFATQRATRKYANLVNQPQVAFLIDSRTNQVEDFHRAAAVTVLGQCEEVAEDKKQDVVRPYLEKHPYLREFIEAPSTAFFATHVETYIYVSHFQEVLEYKVADHK